MRTFRRVSAHARSVSNTLVSELWSGIIGPSCGGLAGWQDRGSPVGMGDWHRWCDVGLTGCKNRCSYLATTRMSRTHRTR